MENLAIGLWGFFYCASVLVLCGAVMAYSRSMHRIGINAGLSVIGPAFVITGFLGGLPIDDRNLLLRLLAALTVVVGALLVYQLLNILGVLQMEKSRRQAKLVFALMGTAAVCMSWMFSPPAAMLICGLVALAMALFAGGVSMRKALRGDSLAWVAVLAVALVIATYFCLSYGVLYPEQWTWQLQSFSAAAASAYVVALAGITSLRYAYLLELKMVMEYGPAYDPITRLRSRSETGQMARDIFNKLPHNNEPLGVIVLTIANLYSLEKLHGIAAVNSALFLIASRLKLSLPARVEIGRLGFDGFLLIMRNCTDSAHLVDLAHDLHCRMHKSAKLKTNPDAKLLETEQMFWLAQVGIGVLHVKNLETTSFDAITISRNMSRTAMSYASRIAWFDHASGEMTELPTHPGMV
jgi:GGDEF domain-containing protein